MNKVSDMMCMRYFISCSVYQVHCIQLSVFLRVMRWSFAMELVVRCMLFFNCCNTLVGSEATFLTPML